MPTYHYHVKLPTISCYCYYYDNCNHNYSKILKSDWLATALNSGLIGQLIGQCSSCVSMRRTLYITNFIKVMINW